MKTVFRFLTVLRNLALILMTIFAFMTQQTHEASAGCVECKHGGGHDGNGSLMKKVKDLYDLNEPTVIWTSSCTSPGMKCTSSGDCCGASMCRDNFCTDPGVGNISPGGHCNSSGECQGASMCRDNFCTDPGVGNTPPGAHCNSSSDCAGSSMCRDNYCTDPGNGNIPPGGHCNSSSECQGSSVCRNNWCS